MVMKGLLSWPEKSKTCIRQAILQTMKETKFQPFLLFFVHDSDENPTTVTCKDQNVIGACYDHLSKWRAQSRFISAFLDAMQHEVYDAAFTWYDWMMTEQTEIVSVHLTDPMYADFTLFVGYPSIELDLTNKQMEKQSPEEKAEILVSLFHAYGNNSGNDLYRAYFCESLAFALSRYYGKHQRYKEGLAFIEKAMELNQRSIHLKTCHHALQIKIEGKCLPERLEKFVGDDTGVLKGKICAEPFRRFDIGPSGDTLVCCGHWLPTPIGNIMRDDIDNVLNSPTAQKIRNSVLDGSYKYCNHLECGAMIQGTLESFDEVADPIMRQAIDTGKVTIEQISQLMFAFDQTCNLACPSCRTHRIVERPSENQAKTETVETKLMPLLKSVKLLYINPAGELLASRPSRKILKMINREECPDLWLDIISNGMLFSREEWEKFPNIHNMVKSLRISTDAATKETFEKLRFLGNFEVFQENMRFLGELRANNIIPQLKFSFTYQRDNFREMVEFVNFCRSFNADFVIFERLQNLGAFTREQFLERAVHLETHPMHQEFIQVIQQPIFANTCVWHDFDWESASRLSTAEAKKRLKSTEEL